MLFSEYETRGTLYQVLFPSGLKLLRVYDTSIYYTGCPQKNVLLWFLAITPLWKDLEIKVGGVSKNSGNSLSDRH